MEYVILGLVLLGAVLLLVRFYVSETKDAGECPSCDQCARIGRPPAENLQQIEFPDPQESESRS